jgi:hypothetical protein
VFDLIFVDIVRIIVLKNRDLFVVSNRFDITLKLFVIFGFFENIDLNYQFFNQTIILKLLFINYCFQNL